MRERVGVLVAGGGINSVLAVYLALNATASRDSARHLLPYQMPVRQGVKPSPPYNPASRHDLVTWCPPRTV